MIEDYGRRFDDPTCVVDIGAGVGVFSEAASKRWPQARIEAVDVNPITLGLQSIAMRAGRNSRVTMHVEDYAAWLHEFQPKGPTLYLGNPPYTRLQLIPRDQRSRLLDSAGGLAGARSNLSTLFVAMTLLKLRPNDALCMLVPAGWLSAGYAGPLRKKLRELARRPITFRLADSWRFDSAVVDAVVITVGPETSAASPILTTDWPGSVLSTNERGEGEAPFRTNVTDLYVGPSEDEAWHLGDVARVTRGTATGANSFFVVAADDPRRDIIDSQWLRPIVRRFRPGKSPQAPLPVTADLLNLGTYSRGADPKLDALLADAEASGLSQGHLCSARPRWYDLSSEITAPDVILSALSRTRFHVYVNDMGAGITNNLFGLFWAPSATARQRLKTLEWLYSDSGQLGLAASASIEANGLRRLSPRTLRTLSVRPGAST